MSHFSLILHQLNKKNKNKTNVKSELERPDNKSHKNICHIMNNRWYREPLVVDVLKNNSDKKKKKNITS